MAPPSLLEGDFDDDEASDNRLEGSPHPRVFVQGCTRLDKQVKSLHRLARIGALPTEAAERQLNTYLLAATLGHALVPKSLMLPLTDAPQPGMLPDLGNVLHSVMARDPIPCTLSTVLEQCIPSLRHTNCQIGYTDSQDVLLNVVMGTLLGLFQDNAKKPCFLVRAHLYTKIHAVLTATKEEQTAFCRHHEEIILLSCMEYIARVVPCHMPAQAMMLTHKEAPTSGFYRRIPTLCDELRQALDDCAEGGTWEEIHALCSDKVARVSRLKRVQANPPHRQPALWDQGGKQQLEVRQYLEVPQLLHATAEEYKLLGLELSLAPSLLQRVQTEVGITPLPRNLRTIQSEALREVARTSQRAAYLRSKCYICIHCLLTHAQRASPMATLRLDTLRQHLVCATCLRDELVAVNLLGRVLSFRKQQYYLCPQCTTIQRYTPHSGPRWTEDLHACCAHSEARGGGCVRKRLPCFWCSEPAAIHTLERVDHLTGEMVQFHYCQRHCPKPEAVSRCYNARHLAAVGPPQSRFRQAQQAPS